ncbi:(+)-neomenthol dehydrogenase [Cajanus cajan]|uniref:Short-chain dehydrogenase/reductase n=1 Tax=Cajanus cajan TaxID=3821 RepID=A0A151TBH9_CAJCA|nr:(+)-neomenthol dehydrogenase [Cajanus cajan]KYP64410.1 (+)-neomenthol dehydrogenase [Cajanus cajan]
MAAATKRYAVVTGANKGIGFGICQQLVSNGITVVLTARDEKRGIEAVEKLKKEFGLSDQVLFHQLDVTDPKSFQSLANFIKTQFGKLDILVNNAGINGAHVDPDAFSAMVASGEDFAKVDWRKILVENYEYAEAGIRTNYYGAKLMCEALIPLLELSDSPRIVNVSSTMGKLEKIPSEWVRGVLSDAESLTEEKVDEVLNQFLKDFKEGSLETKGWPQSFSAYIVSKAAMSAYTRVLAKKYPSFCINAVCPGYVKTDLNYNTGYFTVDEGAQSIVRLALLPNGGPSGLFFSRNEVAPF